MTVTEQSEPLTRRELRERTANPLPPESDTAWDSFEIPGYFQVRKKWATRLSLYAPRPLGAPSTTRQVEVLNTALIAEPTNEEGIYHGPELLSGAPFNLDVFTEYNKGSLESINVVTVGDVGVAKSSLTKTVGVTRPWLLKDRRVVILDKKLQVNDGEGEYGRVVRPLGIEPIKLIIGSGNGGSRLNLLDPALLAATRDGSDEAQYRVLESTAELAQDGKKLTPWESKALRVAHKRALNLAESAGRVPVIGDVIAFLGLVDGAADYDQASLEFSPKARDKFHIAGLTVRFLLDRLCDDLEGLFDGPTSANISLDDKVTSFDLSVLPEHGPSLSIAMMTINTWLIGRIRSEPGKLTQQIVEEGHFLAGGPSGKVVRANTKYSRGLAFSMWTNFHHLSDFPPTDPAVAFIRESGVAYLYRQAKTDDAEMCEKVFGLKPGTARVLQTLPKGECFVKTGTQTEKRIRHDRSELEIQMTETGGAIAGETAEATL